MESTQLTTAELTTVDLANAANGREPQPPDRPETGRPEDPAPGPLLSGDFSESMRTRWETIQAGFVDDPRASVKEADELVASGIQKLAATFSQERARLEQ